MFLFRKHRNGMFSYKLDITSLKCTINEHPLEDVNELYAHLQMYMAKQCMQTFKAISPHLNSIRYIALSHA